MDDYEKKPTTYFEYERSEMLRLVPEGVRRVMDVGCGSGRFGRSVKLQRNAEVWGVEPSVRASREAEPLLDRVFHAEFGEALAVPRHSFDAIVFNDVLEHMVDPWAALKFARKLLTPAGVVVASIPSIRHFPTLWRLVVRKEWRYQDSGTLDRTHLRFFTRQTIEDMFAQAGFEICRIEGINPFHSVNEGDNLWRCFKILNLLTLGRIGDMRFLQYAVQATPLPQANQIDPPTNESEVAR